MKIIDLRSDTVTRPTASMRQAMASAEVGDDVFSEDPTVNRLEEMAAERMGKEAAVFVASGTMANIVSQMAHCGRGDEIIMGDNAHIFFYEQGGSAALGGIHPRTVKTEQDGTLSLEAVERAIRPDNLHFPITRLIALENTHNRCNGSPLSLEYMASVSALTRRYKLNIHVDGARIFNAAAALGTAAADLVAYADSVSFCLSKALAAPVGSLVCGSKPFIAKARRVRKVVGGGMRQAGVIAAAGIVALDEMVDRLSEDHENAKTLALGLSDINGLDVDPEQVFTNIVYMDITRGGLTESELSKRLESEGVRFIPVGPKRLRAVTHYHITKVDVEKTLGVVSNVMR